MKKLFGSKREKMILLLFISLGILIAVTMVASACASNWIYIVRNSNESNPAVIEELNLNSEEKEADFEYICDAVNNSMGFVDEYEEYTGIDYNEYLELYREKLIRSENDYEYYCIVSTLISNIPSSHTRVMYNYNDICSSSIYNKDNVCGIKNINAYADYWGRVVPEAMIEKNIYSFSYMESDGGKYVYNNFSDEPCIFDGYRLKMVNGISVNEYVLTDIYNREITYDGLNDCFFKPALVFSDDENGQPVELTLSDSEGNESMHILYADFDNPYVTPSNMAVYQNKIKSVSLEDFYIAEEYDYAYCLLNNITRGNQMQIADRLSGISSDNIILDLRYNSGGNKQVFSNALAAVISSGFNAENEWLVPATKKNINAIYCRNIFERIRINHDNNLRYTDDGEMLLNNGKVAVEAGSAEKKNLYILVGYNSCSSADWLADTLGRYADAYIIGNNTGGEGLGSPAAMDALPESRIAFAYYPAVSYNSEQRSNSLFGTPPDKYAYEADENGYYICREMLNHGTDSYTLENRLKWDNVLIETLEIIKEKENTK